MAGARPWRVCPGGVEVRVRATPRGGHDAIEGVARLADGTAVLRVRVRAVPEEGAANAALCRILAQTLGLRAGAAAIIAGHTARVKTVRIEGEGAHLAARLAALAGAGLEEREAG